MRFTLHGDMVIIAILLLEQQYWYTENIVEVDASFNKVCQHNYENYRYALVSIAECTF